MQGYVEYQKQDITTRGDFTIDNTILVFIHDNLQ